MSVLDDLSLRIEQRLAPLKVRFVALQPRERVIIVVGSLLVLLTMIYTLSIAPLNKAVTERSARIAQKQRDLVWMQSVAAPLSVLANSQPPPSSQNESLVVVIANSASSGNVAAALTGQTPEGNNGVRVRFEGVQFDALVMWLAALQKDYGIQIKTAEINRAAQPGQVNVNLSLTRG